MRQQQAGCPIRSGRSAPRHRYCPCRHGGRDRERASGVVGNNVVNRRAPVMTEDFEALLLNLKAVRTSTDPPSLVTGTLCLGLTCWRPRLRKAAAHERLWRVNTGQRM
jgi:hypothetical protein